MAGPGGSRNPWRNQGQVAKGSPQRQDRKDFQFPAFYHLPPFFTLQPHAGVRAKQLDLWKQLISEHLGPHTKGCVGRKCQNSWNSTVKKPRPSREHLRPVILRTEMVYRSRWRFTRQGMGRCVYGMEPELRGSHHWPP